jgi:hypothetical protein
MCHTGTVHTAFEQDKNETAVPSWSCSKMLNEAYLFIRAVVKRVKQFHYRLGVAQRVPGS